MEEETPVNYYRPVLDTKSAPVSRSKQIVITDYTFNTDSVFEKPLILFDLPPDIIVSLSEISIPGKIFDYLNPLIVTSSLVGKLVFYRSRLPHSLGERLSHNYKTIQHFDCMRIDSDTIDQSISELLNGNLVVYYPPKYIINYQQGTASKSRKGGTQVCSWITDPPQNVSFNQAMSVFFQAMNASVVNDDDDMDTAEY